MKVFITGTSADDINAINEVVDLLSKVKGPISFHALEPLEKENIQLVVRQFDNDGIKTEKLEFDELINISLLYRIKYGLEKDDEFYGLYFAKSTTKGLVEVKPKVNVSLEFC